MRPIATVCTLLLATLTAACSPGGTRQTIALVVDGGTVVTMDGARRVLSPGAVAIDDGRIVAVDTPDAIAARFRGRDVVDARGTIVLPGLINTHTHAAMVLFRGLGNDLALMDWLQQYIFPAEAKTVSPAFVRTGTRLAALEMIQSGTTTFTDMYYFEDEVARATKEAGLRGVLGQSVIQFPVADAKTPAEGLARAETFISAWKGDRLVTPAVAPHAIYTLPGEVLQAARALSVRYEVPTLIHLAETRSEMETATARGAASPVAYLGGLGFLGPGVVAAHGVWASPEDIALLKASGASVAHNPASNMKLASGTAPVPAYLAAGVPLGLGTDGAASSNDLDMFTAMRLAAFLHKLQTMDPRVLPAMQALELATIGGARALGQADRIGSLEVGKRADLIAVSVAGARQTPQYDPVSHLVYAANGSDVTTTIVDGRVLMRNRKVLTLQAGAVMAEANAAAQQVRAAVATAPKPQSVSRPSVAPAPSDPVWHYEGDEGPRHWGQLSPRFAVCGTGRSQSPIDIVTPVSNGAAPGFAIKVPPASLRIAHHEHVADGINNGHTIQVTFDDGDSLRLGDKAYELMQYHFHGPSEHTLNGRHFPMEMHLVHRAADGRLAVVGVLVREGQHNAAFDPIWSRLPREKGVETHYEHITVDVDALLPAKRTSFRYDGSLTTPPCSEGVNWIVLTEPIELDAAQIASFRALIHENARPVQPLFGRTVIADTVH